MLLPILIGLGLSLDAAERLLCAVNSPLGMVTLEQKAEQLSLRSPMFPGGIALKTAGATASATAKMLRDAESMNFSRGASHADAVLLSFKITDGAQAERSLAVLLVKVSAVWSLGGEWLVEKSADDATGSKDETQTFTAVAGGLLRHVHRNVVENVSFTLPCGCCNAIQTRTIVTDADETYVWNDASAADERSTFQKWYIVQPGEGLLAVARKALGDPRRLARIYALNPQLRGNAAVNEGQRVLVEKE